MTNLFQLKNISYSFAGSQLVLSNINLAINAGESVAILGANGSGKSTLLRILTGLISPSDGEIIAFGDILKPDKLKDNRYMLAYHQKIGFIFQDSDVQLFCNTVQDELAFGLLQLGLSVDVINSRIADIVKLFNINHLLAKATFQLSGGEKKKVALAAVLLLNPQVIILDEPTNSLDPKSQHWLADLLSKLNQLGKTIIITSHNLSWITEIVSRGILLNENHQIVADCLINELLQQDDLLREVNLIY